MHERLRTSICWPCFCALLFLSTLVATRTSCRAEDCPTSADEIETDRPNITNSSLLVPLGSFQDENGVDWTVRHGSNGLDGTNTRLRLRVARCTEFLIDLPNYFDSLNGSEPPGFSNVVVSFKRQLLVPFGFTLSATAGLGFASGSSNIAGPGCQPYIQFPWSARGRRGLGIEWHIHRNLVSERLVTESNF
jgi:hypothetical protein